MWMNDVLHRLKVSDEMLLPERAFTSCKFLVKDYIRARVGDAFNVPTHAWLTSKSEILEFEFPESCIIKPTHASGSLIIRRNGEYIDRDEISSWLDLDYYALRREVNYRYLTRGVIVEPLLFDGGPVHDYKIFCYKGKPRAIQVDVDRHLDHRRNLYDCEWNQQSFTIAHESTDEKMAKPRKLEEMLEVAQKLSADFEFVRVDFYTNDDEVFVGEITHCHGSGWEVTIPSDAEPRLASLLFSNNKTGQSQ
jgi:hypothetical protein